jgi:hypothetical protein
MINIKLYLSFQIQGWALYNWDELRRMRVIDTLWNMISTMRFFATQFSNLPYKD